MLIVCVTSMLDLPDAVVCVCIRHVDFMFCQMCSILVVYCMLIFRFSQVDFLCCSMSISAFQHDVEKLRKINMRKCILNSVKTRILC